MKCLGHTVEAKLTRSKDGLLRAYIDGKLDRSIPPSQYKGVMYRRIFNKLKQEVRSGNANRV